MKINKIFNLIVLFNNIDLYLKMKRLFLPRNTVLYECIIGIKFQNLKAVQIQHNFGDFRDLREKRHT